MRWRKSKSVRGGLLILAAALCCCALAMVFPARYVAAGLVVGVFMYGLLFESETGRKYRQAHRRRHGLCPHCGYDLRATPDRCPECGEAS